MIEPFSPVVYSEEILVIVVIPSVYSGFQEETVQMYVQECKDCFNTDCLCLATGRLTWKSRRSWLALRSSYGGPSGASVSHFACKHGRKMFVYSFCVVWFVITRFITFWSFDSYRSRWPFETWKASRSSLPREAISARDPRRSWRSRFSR